MALLGVSTFSKSVTFSAKGLNPFSLIVNPKYVTSDTIKTHFSYFNYKPHFFTTSKTLSKFWKCLLPFFSDITILYILNTVKGTWLKLFSIFFFWKIPAAECILYCERVGWNKPVRYFLEPLSKTNCWWAWLKSSFENLSPLFKVARRFSVLGTKYLSDWVTLFTVTL